jgi:hypothetical protein
MADVNVKTIQTRIALKYDSYANWTNTEVADQGANLVLLRGELGICEVKATNPQTKDAGIIPTVLFKVGDGETPFKDLPWASAKAADVYAWAKAEDVVVEGKSIKFVGVKDAEGNDKKITFNFATPEEVAAAVKVVADDLSDLDARVVALEGKFTGDNDVQGQLNALDGRLDVIEGADTVEGSVAKALKDAKAYTDTREAAIETAYKAYADQAEADAITAAENASEAKVATERARITAVEGRLDAIEGADGAIADALAEAKSYADQAELDAVASAKTYTDGREAAIKTAYEKYADDAEQAAKDYSDGKLTAAVNTINANDEAQDAEIAKKLDKTTYEAYIAGKSMSDADLKKYAEDEADAAQSAAIAAAKTETEGQISTLVTSGQVKTNTDAIAQNKADIAAMDTAYKKAVSDEAKAREDADKAIDERLVEVEAFFKTADGETLDTALDTLVEIQDYLNGEGEATGGMIGRLAQAETDIDNLQAEFNEGGRVKVAEGKIAALEAKDTELANADKALGERIDALVGDNGTIATSDAATLASAKSYAEEKATAAETAAKSYADGVAATAKSGAEATAKSYTDGQISGLKDTLEAADEALEGNVKTLQDIVDGYEAKGSIKAAVEAAAELAQDGVDAAGVAQAAANKAQGEIDALELVVNNETTGLAATKKIADDAAADLAALTGDSGRVKAAENAIDALELIVNDASKGNDKLRTDVNALQTLTGENGAIRSEIADAKKAGTDAAAAVTALTNGQVATNKTDINTLKGKVTAIEADYLKAADAYIFNCGSATTVTHKA